MTPTYTPAFGQRGAIRWTHDALLAVAGELLPPDRPFTYAAIEQAARVATGTRGHGPGLLIALRRAHCLEQQLERRDDRRRRFVYRVVQPWSEEDVREARRLMGLERREVRP